MAIRRKIVEAFSREKLTDTEIKRRAISKGLEAVKECWPDSRITLTDIISMDLNPSRNNKKKPKPQYPNSLMNKCGHFNKGQILLVYWTAVKKECKKYGKEKEHLLSGKREEELF